MRDTAGLCGLPSLLILLSLDILLQGYAAEEGGFIRAQCPRPEDIHPCTCTRMAKHEDDGIYDSDFESDLGRFARSAGVRESLLSSADTPNLKPETPAPSHSSSSSLPSSPSSLLSSLASSMSSPAGDEEASPTTTTTSTSETLPPDPEITTTTPVFAYPPSSSMEIDLSTLSPRFRVTVNSLSSSHNDGDPDSRPFVTTSDEVDLPVTTTLSLTEKDPQLMSVKYEPTIDTTPPPMPSMDYLMGESITLSPRFTFTTSNSTDATTTTNITAHYSTTTSATTANINNVNETTPPSTTTRATTTTTIETPTPSPSSSAQPSSLPSALPLEQTEAGVWASRTPPATTSSHLLVPVTAAAAAATTAASDPTLSPTSLPPTSEKRIMRPIRDEDIPLLGSSSSSSSSSSGSSGGESRPEDHWSLYETMLVCRNIRSSRVIADALNSMRGYHFNFVILDNVKLPQPFPFSQFQRFSFDYLDLLNLSSLQFVDNFNDKGRDYYYGRSNRGSPGDLNASASSRSSHKISSDSFNVSADAAPAAASSASSSSSSSSWSASADARKQQNSRSRRRRRK